MSAPVPPNPPRPPMLRRGGPTDIVAAVWIGGAALALLAYAVGPDRFVDEVQSGLGRAWLTLEDAVRSLTLAAFDALRATAIGLFGVFVALALLTIRRGGRAKAALIVVSVLFAGLVWGASAETPASTTRWLLALLLGAAGALTMTRRVTERA